MYHTIFGTDRICGDHMVYGKTCGVCDLDCEDQQVLPLCVPGDEFQCRIGCSCIEGYRWHDGGCVPLEECSQVTACPLPFRHAFLPVNTCISICYHLYIEVL